MMSSIVNVLTGVFEAIIIFMFLDTYVERKHPSNIRAYLCAILILSIMINLSNKILNLGLLNFIFVIISTFVIAYIHNRNIKMNLILAIISVLILAISEIIVLFMITIVADVTVKQVESIESFRLLGIILSKLFAFFILKLFCIKHKKNHIFMMKTSYWILFLIMKSPIINTNKIVCDNEINAYRKISIFIVVLQSLVIVIGLLLFPLSKLILSLTLGQLTVAISMIAAIMKNKLQGGANNEKD